MEILIIILTVIGVALVLYVVVSHKDEVAKLEKQKKIKELEVETKRIDYEYHKDQRRFEHEQVQHKMEYDRFHMEMFERKKELELRERELRNSYDLKERELTSSYDLKNRELLKDFELGKMDRLLELHKLSVQIRLAEYELGHKNQKLSLDANNDNELRRIEMMERLYKQERERVQFENEQKRSAYMLSLQAIIADAEAKIVIASKTGDLGAQSQAEREAQERINQLRNSLGI